MTDQQTAQHTPEPWHLCRRSRILIHSAQSQQIARAIDLYRAPAERFANARRIVAAVNACEGIPTEALETGVVPDLLDACRAGLGHLDGDMESRDGELHEQLAAAIAKATG